MADTESGRTDGGAARPYRLFVSYSHKNEARKDRLIEAIKPLKRSGLIEIWTDRAIPAGADWRREIDAAMEEADTAIFIVCRAFLASDFCQEVEVEYFLDRHHNGQVLILFVLAEDCLWEEFDYLRRFQMVPRDGKSITDLKPKSTAYTIVAREIRDALKQHQAEFGPRPPVGAVCNRDPAAGDVISQSRLKTAPTAEFLAKLPGQTPRLFGRADELRHLDAWHRDGGVLLWVAEGGYGKSALARWWLERHDFAPGTRFLGHSFYSQGSHNQATSARPFLLESLKAWGVAHAIDAPDDELGRLLAEAAAKSPSLIVLDGMEPLQQLAPGDARLHGLLRDKGLAALLAGLAETPGQVACLATSRLRLPESSAPAGRFRQRELGELPPAEAQALLAQRGVRGGADEPAEMAQRCGHHPLALVLAAEFCHSFLDDAAARFLARDWPALDTGGAHARTIMGWFDATLADERQQLDRDLARVLGLFDRPAPWKALQALREREPPIPGLTEALHRAGDEELLEALARLRQWGLLHADLARPEPDLDAHPLVREHFGEELERENPDAFRAAHRLLFDWFRGLPEKHQPDTLEEMEPLYRAMGHGCKAGAYRTALND